MSSEDDGMPAASQEAELFNLNDYSKAPAQPAPTNEFNSYSDSIWDNTAAG